MATDNLSAYSKKGIGEISKKKFAFVVSEWNEEITESLYAGAVETLVSNGAKKKKHL